MGISASSCFSKNQKVDSLKIEKPEIIRAVQAVKSETLKSTSSSCSILHDSPTASFIQPENDRTFSRTLINKIERSFTSIESAKKQSNCSKFETHEITRDSSEFWKDQDEYGIRRPANPTPRESDAFLGAVLSGSVEVHEDNSQVSTLKPKSDVNLNRNANASHNLYSETVNQAGFIITSKTQSDLRDDHNSPMVVEASSIDKPVSLGTSLPQFAKPLQNEWFKSDSSSEASGLNGRKPGHPLVSLPNQKPPAVPSLSQKKKRPKQGTSSSRVPVFTDPLIIDGSDIQYDVISVQTATQEPLTAVNEIPDVERCRKLRPLHGKSSSRVPVFTDPLLLRDCGEECEKEIFDQTRDPQVERMDSGDGFVNDKTAESQGTRGCIKLAPLEMGKKSRPMHGRSSNRVPVFTDPMIIGKDKPVPLKKIPKPLKKESISQSWKSELDKVLLGDSGRHDSILLPKNRSDDRIMEVVKRHSNQMLLDDFVPNKTVDVGQGIRPKLTALKNPWTSSSQSGPSKDSLPFTDHSGQIVSPFTTNSEKSFEKSLSLLKAISSEVIHSRERKLSNVKLDPLSTNTGNFMSESGQDGRPEI